MPYIKRITKAGKVTQVEMYYSAKYNHRGYKKQIKDKPTTEQQKKINIKRAERKLGLIMDANYSGGDLHVVLPYIKKKGEEPIGREQMRKDVDKFLRKLRAEYKKQGKELKYIHVMEVGKKGARHHHLLINNFDINIIRKLWTHARAMFFPLDDSGNYKDLASYFIKYSSTAKGTENELQKKLWNASKNLIHPESEVKIINRAWFRKDIKPQRGYYVDKSSVEMGITSGEYGGYEYIRYLLIQEGKNENFGNCKL